VRISSFIGEIQKIIDKNVAHIYAYFIGYAVILGAFVMAATTEKREKFKKLAVSRTQSALDAIRKIGNLSNKRAYQYDDADIKKIVKALRDAMTEVERKFGTSVESGDNKFKL
jgi:hypothetical protein